MSARTLRPGAGGRVRRHVAFLFRDSMVYGVAGALNRVVKILLIPIVAKAYSTEIYGAFDSLNVYLYVAAVVAILGLNSAVVIVATADGRASSPGNLRAPAVTSFRVVLAASAGLAGLLILGARIWSDLLLGSARFTTPLVWAALSIPCSAVFLFTLSLLQWSFRRTWYVGIAFGTAVLTIGLTWIAATRTPYGLTGFFVANLIGQGAGAAAGVFAARDMLHGDWDRGALRRLLALGLPFAVIGAAGTLLPSIDRLFLVQAHSLDTTAVYALGQKIAALSALVLAGFQAAWGPFAFARRSDPDKARLFSTGLLLVATAVAALGVLCVLAAPFISRVMATEAYAGAAMYVGPLALSTGLTAVFAVVAIGSVMEGRTLHNLAAYIAGLSVTLGLNIVLVLLRTPPVGIAWANMAGQLSAVVVMAALSQRVHHVPYPFVRTVLILVVAALVVAELGGRVATMSGAAISYLMLALVATTGAWCWAAVLNSEQRARIVASVRRATGAGS
jgi:O-antigen/teichoic acid export membrane protein